MSYDAVVVGAGFAGSVMAERLARKQGKRVLVLDRRPHVGGNAYDEPDAAGILIHRYGPHIFHTNSSEIVDYLSTFTEWRPYEHRVLACVRGQLVPIPINRTTVNRLFGLGLKTDDDVAAFYASRAEPVERKRTSEDVVVGAVGRELYELFFRGYTRKQWGLDPSQLDASVTARVPTRTNDDDRYFTDRFQLMPADGYTAMFERMLDHPRIEVRTGVDFHDIQDDPRLRDARLHRSSRRVLRPSVRPRCRTDRCASSSRRCRSRRSSRPAPSTIRTRRRCRTPGSASSSTSRASSTTRPRSSASSRRRRAIPTTRSPAPKTGRSTSATEALADATPGVHFVGRLATYKYYNMDQVVGQALATFRKISRGRERGSVTGPSRPAVWAGVEPIPSHHRGPPQGPAGRDRPCRPSRGHRPDRRARRVGRPLSHPLGLARRADRLGMGEGQARPARVARDRTDRRSGPSRLGSRRHRSHSTRDTPTRWPPTPSRSPVDSPRSGPSCRSTRH